MSPNKQANLSIQSYTPIKAINKEHSSNEILGELKRISLGNTDHKGNGYEMMMHIQ
jgi:hypothetical protein